VVPEARHEPAPPPDLTERSVEGSLGNGGVAQSDAQADDPPPPPPSPPVPAPRPEPVRVGGAIRPPQKIHDVAPRYPVIAQQSRVAGLVILEAVISEDGAVQSVRVLRSQPLLDSAAVEAVRQWRFTSTLLNGQPVPVVMTVTVNFRLD
jgi:protein TonB